MEKEDPHVANRRVVAAQITQHLCKNAFEPKSCKAQNSSAAETNWGIVEATEHERN
jgi:hypothetical protein